MEEPLGFPQAPATIPDPDQLPRLFQCNTCKRSFTRADHLTRHVRSHTRQKPYVCETCSKGFARVDLLKRHAANHGPDQTNKRPRRETVNQSRVVQACEGCSQNHLRCEDDKPCGRCRKKNIPCRVPQGVYDYQGEAGLVHDSLDIVDNFDHSSTSIADDISMTAPNREVSLPEESMYMPTAMDQSGGIGEIPCYDEMSGIDPFLPDYFRNLPPFEAPSGQATPRGIMDFNLDWNVGLNDLDLGLLDQYSLNIPFNAVTPSTEHALESSSSADPNHDGVAIRAEVFKRSVWRYVPQANRENGSTHQPNLAFCDEEPHAKRLHFSSRRAVEERLHRTHRDKLLALVLSTCNPGNVNRIASAFPSIELLDGLIQYFLTSSAIDARTWIHMPTFSPSNLRPELLSCIVAAGAIATPDEPLRKLGFALHEASRLGQAKAFEEDNSLIRSLQHMQSMLLQLEIGVWSGISRKMEIAESFLQPLVTMLRRGGRFRRFTWKEIVPTQEDEGQVLEDKWQQWVFQESYLRLVYRTFQHDRQSSMALLKPPLISYSEMHLPVIHSNAIWQASSAAAWKSAYIMEPASAIKRPSPVDCLLDLGCLTYHETASATYLDMLWGMIWEYRQIATLTARSTSKTDNSLILSSRHQELTKRLDDFRVSSLVSSKSIEITLEFMLMHLNAPLEVIQLFAGIDGQDEARRAYPTLKDWVPTAVARQALWHGGQIIKAASGLSKGLLCNYNAIAVYHAALVFWCYGFLKSPGGSGINLDHGTLPVSIDGSDELAAKRFVSFDRGLPAITVQGEQEFHTQLSDISGVVDRLTHLLRANHDTLGGPYPPLVENLVQLMEGLRSATK